MQALKQDDKVKRALFTQYAKRVWGELKVAAKEKVHAPSFAAVLRVYASVTFVYACAYRLSRSWMHW